MSDLIWLGAILLLALPGTIVCRVPSVARMPLTARLALAFAAGTFIAALLMYAYALSGITWSRTNLYIPLIVVAVYGVARRLPHAPAPAEARRSQWILPAVFLALTLYAIGDARATCGDIVFIWAPKAQAFAHARTIDLKFLAFPHYYLMHPDYPPLVPLTYAFGSLAAHRLSWWGALFLSFFIIVAIIAVMRAFVTPSSALTLVTAIVSFAFVSAYLPGGADPFLILFESIAVIGLTFAPESRDVRWLAALSLAAAAFTKVEGASFAIIVAIAFALSHRRVIRAVALLLPAAVLLASWLIFMGKHNLLDQYARASSPIVWNLLRDDLKLVWRFASFRARWLPWLAAFAPLLIVKLSRKIMLPLLVAAGCFTAAIFFYLHNPDPAYWIASSADRILVTPLICVAIASAAAWSDAVQADRLADAAVRQPA